jgi:hypothetical protein
MTQFKDEFMGKPVFIHHIGATPPNELKDKICGFISNTFLTNDNSRLSGTFVLWDKEAISLMRSGWETSSTWQTLEKIDYKGMHNGVPYDYIPLTIKALYLAIVPEGRYESQNITHDNSLMTFSNQVITSEDSKEEKFSIDTFRNIFSTGIKMGKEFVEFFKIHENSKDVDGKDTEKDLEKENGKDPEEDLEKENGKEKENMKQYVTHEDMKQYVTHEDIKKTLEEHCENFLKKFKENSLHDNEISTEVITQRNDYTKQQFSMQDKQAKQAVNSLKFYPKKSNV